jgi:formate/nitrite transporter FocA (FNT family)
MAIYQSLMSKQLGGKIIGMFFPILGFAAVGYEHSIANMFYISIGMMYGANVTIGQFFLNLVAVIIGNIIGGSFLIAASHYYFIKGQ